MTELFANARLLNSLESLALRNAIANTIFDLLKHVAMPKLQNLTLNIERGFDVGADPSSLKSIRKSCFNFALFSKLTLLTGLKLSSSWLYPWIDGRDPQPELKCVFNLVWDRPVAECSMISRS